MSSGGSIFVTDEGFNRNILRGVLSRNPTIDIVRVQDVGLSRASDPDILEWAAEEGRIILTHDKSTLRADAIARVITGLPMPGVIVVHQDAPEGRAIEGLLLMIETTPESEWENQVRFVARR